MKARVKLSKGNITFTSLKAKAIFFEKNEGKDAIIEIDENPSSEIRRYFEGCIVPTVYYTHPQSGWNDFRDAREALKLEFLPTRNIVPIRGVPQKVASSTTMLTKERFRAFIEAIARWLLENEMCGAHDIDPQNYKTWQDSAPPAGEIYPPLARLKTNYDKVKHTVPPWRKIK